MDAKILVNETRGPCGDAGCSCNVFPSFHQIPDGATINVVASYGAYGGLPTHADRLARREGNRLVLVAEE
jgi:hypothetical protein